MSVLSESQGTTLRQRLAAALERELLVHSQVEREVFYPACWGATLTLNERRMYERAVQLNLVLESTAAGLSKLDPQTSRFEARLRVLRASLRGHALEAGGAWFVEARKALGRPELVRLGGALKIRRDELARVADRPAPTKRAGPSAPIAERAAQGLAPWFAGRQD